MIIVERIVPPRAVFFLHGQQSAGQVVLIEATGRRPAIWLMQERRVVVAEVVKVAGDLKVRLVRDRPLAADVEPAVAGDQPIEPILETCSVTFGSPQSRSARLHACDRPRLPPGRLIGIIGSYLRYSP